MAHVVSRDVIERVATLDRPDRKADAVGLRELRNGETHALLQDWKAVRLLDVIARRRNVSRARVTNEAIEIGLVVRDAELHLSLAERQRLVGWKREDLERPVAGRNAHAHGSSSMLNGTLRISLRLSRGTENAWQISCAAKVRVSSHSISSGLKLYSAMT